MSAAAPEPKPLATRDRGVDSIRGFDVELGYWDRELSLQGDYPEAIRQRTEPARFAEAMPAHDLRECVDERTRRLGRAPRVLDVGSGPLSMLAEGPHRGLFELVAADPLAEHYQRLLKRHGYAPGYPLVPCFGERLAERFAPASFDLVWIHNALDHSQDPAQVLAQCATVLAPGGFLLCQGWSREGTAERWYGLHQHDLFLADGGHLMCETRRPLGRAGRLVNRVLPCVRWPAVTRRLDAGLPLELVTSSTPTTAVKQWLRVVWRKRGS